MERVTGIGGIFLKSDDPKALYEWYEKHLGIQQESYGAVFRWREHADPEKSGSTAWSIFKRDSTYFDPTNAPFMINYRVKDLDALLAALREEGVWIDEKRSEEFGKFAWIRDLDGNRIELWEPPAEG